MQSMDNYQSLRKCLAYFGLYQFRNLSCVYGTKSNTHIPCINETFFGK